MQRILIIYTGGTIGMINDPVTGMLKSVDFEHVFDHVPELRRFDVELKSISFEKPIDSSEIDPSHWAKIGKLIYENYEDFDGFVVLHGSDTMSYTASALSFMFSGLKKPIVLTGSQLPIGVIRTDGKENLITAIEIASKTKDNGDALIQEVVVYFDYQLFRGNRSTKDSAENFGAFRSPSLMPLANAGVEISFQENLFFKDSSSVLELKPTFNNRVLLIKLFPGINVDAYDRILNRDNFDGLIIESFGAGNSPANSKLESILKQFTEEGGVVLNITQCNSGKVQPGMYDSSAIFTRVGAISGCDMTTEAAVTKLMHLLANCSFDEVKVRLAQNLRGELSC